MTMPVVPMLETRVRNRDLLSSASTSRASARHTAAGERESTASSSSRNHAGTCDCEFDLQLLEVELLEAEEEDDADDEEAAAPVVAAATAVVVDEAEDEDGMVGGT